MVLNRNLSEKDANDILSTLKQHQIRAQKQSDKEGLSISVAYQDSQRAVSIINAAGLPRQSRTSMGQIFQKNGLISSPLEERARYLYALSQEVESTLAQIDGVVVARVHIVLPERIAPGEPIHPASASVFIKYRDGLEPDSIELAIRRLVTASIPGLSGDKKPAVSIVFVPMHAYQDNIELVKFGPFTLSGQQFQQMQWGGTLGAALLIGWLFWRYRQRAAPAVEQPATLQEAPQAGRVDDKKQ